MVEGQWFKPRVGIEQKRKVIQKFAGAYLTYGGRSQRPFWHGGFTAVATTPSDQVVVGDGRLVEVTKEVVGPGTDDRGLVSARGSPGVEPACGEVSVLLVD